MPDDRGSPHADPRETGNELVDLLRRYVLQETLDPLKSAGRRLAFGSIAAVLLGVGSILVLVAILRVLQGETGDTFAGTWTFVPYLITIFVGIAMLGGFGLIILKTAGRDEIAPETTTTNRSEGG